MPQEAAFSIYVIFNCTYLIIASRQAFKKTSLPSYYANLKVPKIHFGQSWTMPNGVLEKRKPAPLWPQRGITSGKFKQLFELHQLCRKDFNSNVCSYFSTKKGYVFVFMYASI